MEEALEQRVNLLTLCLETVEHSVEVRWQALRSLDRGLVLEPSG